MDGQDAELRFKAAQCLLEGVGFQHPPAPDMIHELDFPEIRAWREKAIQEQNQEKAAALAQLTGESVDAIMAKEMRYKLAESLAAQFAGSDVSMSLSRRIEGHQNGEGRNETRQNPTKPDADVNREVRG